MDPDQPGRGGFLGLLDDIAGKLAGGTPGSGGGKGLVAFVVEMLGSRQGGLAGLAAAFQQKGLGTIVSSWIGTGQNLPVSPDQIQQVLGEEQVRDFAQKTGISTLAAGSKLAELLPGVVDKLTPVGQVPEGDDLKSAGLGLLLNLMSGRKPES